MRRKLEKLILALGSDIVMDDAISIMLAKDLKQLFPDFKLEILPVGGIEIIELIAGFNLVVIIDTMISPETNPGEIILFSDLQSVRTLHLQNPHDVDFYTSIRLAEVTGYRIPEKIVVLGVRIKQQLVASLAPSPWIRKKYSKMIEQISIIISQVSI
jgi:hydrogenase maturation protease